MAWGFLGNGPSHKLITVYLYSIYHVLEEDGHVSCHETPGVGIGYIMNTYALFMSRDVSVFPTPFA